MDARPAWIAGKRESLLNTAVFATTDSPPELIPGGGDDYQALPGDAASARPQVRWRPRQPAPDARPSAAETIPLREPSECGGTSPPSLKGRDDRSSRVRPGNGAISREGKRRQVAALQIGASRSNASPATMTAGATGAAERAGRWQGRPSDPAHAVSDADEASPAFSDDSAQVAPLWVAASRGVAAFLGAFALLNVLGEMRHPGFDANLWWIDLRPLPPSAARAALALAGMLLLAFGVFPGLWFRWRRATLATLGLLLAASVWNTASYYRLLRAGDLHSGPAVPFSMHVSACLIVILAGVRAMRGTSCRPRQSVLVGSLAFAICLLAFPLAQMQCFGHSDYRRPADVIVVFGCHVNADGTPSDALADRVTTACRLYHDGLASRIIVSGGPGPGEIHETDAMRKLALAHGVPPQAIEADRDGVNTAATVANTARLCRDQSHGRILAVSHAYHLPRIKLCYRRAGLEVFTVPAVQEQPLQRQTWYCLREMAALWWYYGRPLADL
jgi:uncharacterized SAM-binding protein YcdF (DUF218 family)